VEDDLYWLGNNFKRGTLKRTWFLAVLSGFLWSKGGVQNSAAEKSKRDGGRDTMCH
jgi:hypothetical protein